MYTSLPMKYTEEEKELLETVATNAEIPIRWDFFRDCYRLVGPMGFLLEDWCPLYNDGDAFRLAVKMKLEIEIKSHSSVVGEWAFCHRLGAAEATRKAIVYAVADGVEFE